MTTYAANEDTDRRLSELDDRTRGAWDAYSAAIKDLQGDEYDEVERTSWDVLQLELGEIDTERRELVALAGLPADPS